jgi:surface antigen
VYGYAWASRCPSAGIADKVDRWKMYACNCTSYVAWALAANDQRTDWFIPGAMDAWNWPHVASLSEIETGTQPRVGAIAVWPKLSPPFGHMAYVTAVHAGGTFDVAEYNFGPLDGYAPYTFDLRKDLRASGAVFVYVPRRS